LEQQQPDVDVDVDLDLDVEEDVEEDSSDKSIQLIAVLSSSPSNTQIGQSVVRPGIVHRLDKGTTGLLVVAKTDKAHQSLCQQFKKHTITREYWSLTLKHPPKSGRVATNIGRDLRDRKKMASFAYGSALGRTAASNYKVVETLLDGAVALVSWRLETGRTHQIRVHAKHMGCPLIGDDVYGGGAGIVADSIMMHGMSKKKSSSRIHTSTTATYASVGYYKSMVEELGRPALHAKTIGFQHPENGEMVYFECELPNDFREVLEMLRKISVT